MNSYKQISILIIFLNSIFCYGQDQHSSHVFNTNIITNPGVTGINGKQRALISYRNQWSSANSPFTTYLFAADGRLPTTSKAKIGIGFYAMRDMAGELKYGNTLAMLATSIILPTSKFGSLSFSLQGGYAQQSISTQDMKWSNQYQNGAYSASNETGETINFSPFGYADFNIGAAYKFNNNDNSNTINRTLSKKEYEIGLAAHHLLQPSLKHNGTTNNKLRRKYVAHFSGVFGFPNSNISLKPAVLLMKQGDFQEVGVGLLAKYYFSGLSMRTNTDHSLALSLGAYYRFKDAVVPSIFLEYNKYAVGATFGLNHSDLQEATKTYSGLEVIIRYINF